MKWNRTELLEKLHIGSVFMLLLFGVFLVGAIPNHSPFGNDSYFLYWCCGILAGR